MQRCEAALLYLLNKEPKHHGPHPHSINSQSTLDGRPGGRELESQVPGRHVGWLLPRTSFIQTPWAEQVYIPGRVKKKVGKEGERVDL